jgi:hypothetical protein
VQVPAQRSMPLAVRPAGLAPPIDEERFDEAPEPTVPAQPEPVPQVAALLSALVVRPGPVPESPDSAEFRCCSLRIRSPGP